MESKVDRKDIIVIIPTYNEAKNIALLTKELFSLNMDFSILIVDDNSPDGTSRIVEKLQDIYPNLHIITRKMKMGLGSAYVEGFNFALRNGYKIIVQMDADLSHSPNYIIGMIRVLANSDLVVGSRYFRNAGVVNWPLGRILLSKSANVISKVFLSMPINDLTSGFKCMRREVLEAIDYPSVTTRGYVFQIELVYRAFLKGFKIIEYPIIFKGRKDDKSKMNIGIIFEAILKLPYLSFINKC